MSLPKSFSLLILALITLALVADLQAGDYRLRKKRGEFTLDIAINRNPPIMGNNTITIKIKDAQGEYLLGAKVDVNYYMPPMPGMPPMNYTVPANPDGDEYAATMDFIMTGPWNIVVKVDDGKKPWRSTFPIDVR
jgi:hypothetical protein